MEIKFEYGFQSQNGIVKKVYDIDQIPRIAQICDVWNELPICYIRQSLGFKDINGVEIYEGDIVKYYKYNNPSLKMIGVVEYSLKTASYVINCFSQSENLKGKYYFTKDRNYTIIGNKYENPELLTTI